MSGRLRHWKSDCIAQAEGHYFVMVQHAFDTTKNRNVMKMWKLGGSGLMVMFHVGVTLNATYDAQRLCLDNDVDGNSSLYHSGRV